jgi:hypothetical protein
VYEPNHEDFNDLYKDDMQEERLNTMSLNRSENKVKKELIICVLVIDEVLRKSLVELFKDVSMVL